MKADHRSITGEKSFRRRWLWAAAGITALPGLSACGSNAAEREPTATTTRDSAEVRIVENIRNDAVARHVPTGPPSEFAGESADFDFYRVVAAVRLADGRIVAGNAGTHELLVFDEAGRLRHRFGREGDGPGEYRSLAWLAEIGDDSVITYDDRLRRLDIISADGVHLSSSRLEPAADAFFPEFVGMFGDGSLLAFIGEPFSDEPAGSEVRYRDSLTVLRYHPDGSLLGTLGRFPNQEAFYVRSETGDIAWSEIPFGRTTALAADSDRFHVVTGDAYEIRSYDTDGDLRRIIRVNDERVEVTPSERDSFLRRRHERISQIEDPARRRLHEELLERIPFPERHSGYGDIAVGGRGELWAQRDEERWDVFTADGRLTAEARLPSRIDVYEIGADYVVGGWRDELDIEHLGLIRIVTVTSAEERNDDS